MAKFFDYILQGSDATEENAIQAARSLDWQEVETQEADYPNLQYVGTLNGVGIYYNYGHDGYYFTDEDAEDDYEPEEITQEPFQQVDGLGDLGTFGLNESVRKLIREVISENDTYFETLSQTLDYVREEAEKLGYELDEESLFFHFGTGGISYETTKNAVIELLKDGQPILGKSGRPLNRAMNISIYRMPSGKYELTSYKTW